MNLRGLVFRKDAHDANEAIADAMMTLEGDKYVSHNCKIPVWFIHTIAVRMMKAMGNINSPYCSDMGGMDQGNLHWDEADDRIEESEKQLTALMKKRRTALRDTIRYAQRDDFFDPLSIILEQIRDEISQTDKEIVANLTTSRNLNEWRTLKLGVNPIVNMEEGAKEMNRFISLILVSDSEIEIHFTAGIVFTIQTEKSVIQKGKLMTVMAVNQESDRETLTLILDPEEAKRFESMEMRVAH